MPKVDPGNIEEKSYNSVHKTVRDVLLLLGVDVCLSQIFIIRQSAYLFSNERYNSRSLNTVLLKKTTFYFGFRFDDKRR